MFTGQKAGGWMLIGGALAPIIGGWLQVPRKGPRPPEAAVSRTIAAQLGPEARREVVVHGDKRCDIVYRQYAFEIDQADKWYEGIGQSLFYALELNKNPGLILIVSQPGDEQEVELAAKVAWHYGIYLRTWDARRTGNRFAVPPPAKKFVPPRPSLLNINAATADELERLPGIGPVLAEAIVKGRPYRALDDLTKVKGIGEKKLASLKEYVTTR